MLCEIKREIDFFNTTIIFVVEEYVVHRVDELEVIEHRVENYRDQKIHFSVNQLDQIFKAFKGEIEEAVWAEIENMGC